MKIAKKLFIYLIVSVVSLLNLRAEDLASRFKVVEDEVQTYVYWYWINDCVTKEGVLKDLDAMKAAGIGRAYIGFINLDDRSPEYGSCKLLSEEWWETLRAMFIKADELSIDIGMFNSPGWSQSGGSWITPDRAMRYVKTLEYQTKGGVIEMSLPTPPENFQDLALLAFKKPSNYFEQARNGSISASVEIKNLSNLIDDDNNSITIIDKACDVIFNFDELVDVSSLSILTNKSNNRADCQLFVMGDDSEYQPLKEFKIDRFNYDVKVGFIPDSPTVIAFEPTKARRFKIMFKNFKTPLQIKDIAFQKRSILESYPEKTLAKMHQGSMPQWNKYMWDINQPTDEHSEIINSKDIVNLTSELKDGVLKCNLPEGEWIIQRMGMFPTGVTNHPTKGVGKGLEVDKMNRDHIRFHFDSFIGVILGEIKAEERKAFKYVIADSYETGGQNISDGMLDIFEQTYGYDPTPYLPTFSGVIINDSESTNRFLWDCRRLIADKIAYEYVGGLRDICHENGMSLWLENYGHWGFPSEFLMYGGQSDEIGGEFWVPGNLAPGQCCIAAASCGHIYGKNIITAESFTSSMQGKPYRLYPALLKQAVDKSYSEGINSTMLHVNVSQPQEEGPGFNTWFGTEFNRNNTWYPYLHLFVDYIKRSCLMLREGQNLADVAYYIGEDAPKMIGIQDPNLPKGYKFDYINAEVIIRDLEVKDGELVLPHGTKYKVLVLPPETTMRPEVLSKIERLLTDGATILGGAPSLSPSNQNQPNADIEVRDKALSIWGREPSDERYCRSVGRGKLYVNYSLEELFADINLIPDLRIEQDGFAFTHRECSDRDIYFVANLTSKSKESVKIQFRTDKRGAQHWNPINGAITLLPNGEEGDGFVELELDFDINESKFIVFDSDTKGKGYDFERSELLSKEEVDGAWSVRFNNDFIGVDETIEMSTLKLWNTLEDKQLKYFSGSAIYASEFTVDNKRAKAKRITLDLGKVEVIAKVYINDIYAGGAWTYPYSIDIENQIKKGRNTIRVEVANSWVNHLIGDSALHDAQRKTKITLSTWSQKDKLHDSGLVGPVSISYYK